MAKHRQQDDQKRLVNDAAKSLLANIRFMSVDSPIKTIAITSTIPNEGKSFVSINLAQAIASSGKTCLIVEGDLRKRSLAAAMGIHPQHGMYAVLSGEVPFNKAAVATPQRNLYFLDSEPQIPNPSDLFGSKRFADFLEKVSQQFDYVLIDTPPVGTFIDGAVIARHVDATFLVVRENFTKRNFILSAFEQLQQAGAHVAGVVMNACRAESDTYYGYGYYSYYEKNDKAADKSSVTNNAFSPEGKAGKPAHSAGKAARPAGPVPAQSAKPAVQDPADEYDSEAIAAAVTRKNAAQYSRKNYQQRGTGHGGAHAKS